MKIFELRDERIIGDILVRYLTVPDEDWFEEAFQSTCRHCCEKDIHDITEISDMLIANHGFKPFKVDSSFTVSEGTGEDDYYNDLQDVTQFFGG